MCDVSVLDGSPTFLFVSNFCNVFTNISHTTFYVSHSKTHTTQNQSQRRAPLRQPPPTREPLRDSLRKQRQQAVAQLRELERRAKLHKPVVDIPTPHIGEHRDIENVLRLGESSSSLTEFRAMQTRNKKALPHFFSVDQQWKRAMGN